MTTHTDSPLPWYKKWFDWRYPDFYPERDEAEAESQVAYVCSKPIIPSSRPVLDIACGNGRHLEVLLGRGKKAVGLDLSPFLLGEAREKMLPVVRGDMLEIPFRPGMFGLATLFFSSFGYFETPEKDIQCLGELARLLAPGGVLFMDLANKQKVIEGLVPFDRFEGQDYSAEQRRKMEGDVVVKSIVLKRRRGPTEIIEERLRLYTREKLAEEGEKLGLQLVIAEGDNAGAPFDPMLSNRMYLFFQKSGGPGAG